MRSVKWCSCQGGIEHNLSSYTHTPSCPPPHPLSTYNQSGFRTTIPGPLSEDQEQNGKLGRPAAPSSPGELHACRLQVCLLLFLLFLQEALRAWLLCSRVHNPGHSGNLLQFSLYQTQHFCIDTLPSQNPFSIIKRPDTGSQKNLPPRFPLPAKTHPFSIYSERNRRHDYKVCKL